MTVLSADSIRRLCVSYSLVSPFVERSQHLSGMSFGLSACGYDIRLDQDVCCSEGVVVLASSLERFRMPLDIVGVVHDKSTLARRGLAVQNTVIEPGWEGFLTLELTWSPRVNTMESSLCLLRGSPIAQVLFHKLDQATSQPYTGKYQNQEPGPQEAR